MRKVLDSIIGGNIWNKWWKVLTEYLFWMASKFFSRIFIDFMFYSKNFSENDKPQKNSIEFWMNLIFVQSV